MIINIKDIPTLYINLAKDKHKDSNMKKLGKDLGISKYKRFNGVEVSGNRILGIAKSHQSILNSIKEPTMVLEDDCVVLNKNTLIDIPDDADAIYLGISSWGYKNGISEKNNFTYKKHKDFKNIYKIDGMLALHSVIYISKEYVDMSNRTAKWSIDNNEPVDSAIASIQKYFNIYALGNPIFFQRSSEKLTNIKLEEIGQ